MGVLGRWCAVRSFRPCARVKLRPNEYLKFSFTLGGQPSPAAAGRVVRTASALLRVISSFLFFTCIFDHDYVTVHVLPCP